MTIQAVTCDGKALITALGDAARPVEHGSKIPALQNVRLTADNGRLGIAGTNLDIALEVYVEAAGSLDPVLVNAAKLTAALKGRETQVSMQIDEDQRLRVTCGRSRLHLVCMPGSELPILEAPDGEQATLDGNLLKRGLDFCGHAVSRSGSRPQLEGVFVDGAAGCLVATDGHRLARRPVPSLEGLESVLVPDKTAKILGGLLDGEVRIWGDDRLIAFEGKNWRLVSKLVDQTYPDYQRVIPQFDGEASWRLDRDEFLTELTAVAAVSPDKTDTVRMEMSEGTLRISSRYEGNDAESEIDAEGPDGLVGINARYLMDALRLCGENVSLYGDGPSAPWRVELEDGIGTLVIMPLRV